MKLKVDKESDALYFRLDEEAIAASEEVQPGVLLDFDKDKRVVGVEILRVSTRAPIEMLHTLQLESV